MKYVYCLAKNIESIDAFPPGLGDMKVYQVSFEGIAALVSDVEKASLLGNAQNALLHQAVVQEALKFCTSLIPCRFGALLAGEEEILSLLKRHHAHLEDELARLEGKLEVSIRTIFDGSDLPVREARTQTGVQSPMSKVPNWTQESLTEAAKYLLEKKQRFDAVKELTRKAERFSQELNEATAPFWAEVKTQKRPIGFNRTNVELKLDNGLLLSFYYLVDWEKLSSFKCAYQQFKERWPGLKLLYTGPWPPYSFADIDLRDQKKAELTPALSIARG